jgi:hypothetical protein
MSRFPQILATSVALLSASPQISASPQDAGASSLEGTLPARPSATQAGAAASISGEGYLSGEAYGRFVNRLSSESERQSRFKHALEQYSRCLFGSEPLKVYSGLAQFLESKFGPQLTSEQRQEYARLAAWRETKLVPADGWMPSFELGLRALTAIETSAARALELRPSGSPLSAASFAHLPEMSRDDAELALSFLNHKNCSPEAPLREFLMLSDLLDSRATALAVLVGVQTTHETAPEVFDRVLQAWELSIERQRGFDLLSNVLAVAVVGLGVHVIRRSRDPRTRADADALPVVPDLAANDSGNTRI